jgi:putative methyltransferase (TIGR04325 family)
MNENSYKGLKQTLRDLLVSLPIISDYYLYHWVFPRASASCREVFASYAAAKKAIPERDVIGYNQPNFYSSSPQENIKNMEIIATLNKPIDYPVLVWLREAFTDSSNVFDLGGNTGFGYYGYQKFMPFPAGLKWQVCDLPEAVKAGREILNHIDSPGLSYTTQAADAEGSDIFITCGTLQYVEPSLGDLLGQLTTLPRHLIIHHVPLYDGEEYFTWQNLLESYVPYKIQNRDRFIASLTDLGYELIDSWEVDRTCRIPFHPERFVRAYHGFYLRLKGATKLSQIEPSLSQSVGY